VAALGRCLVGPAGSGIGDFTQLEEWPRSTIDHAVSMMVRIRALVALRQRNLRVVAAEETLALWGIDGLDFGALAADIVWEAMLALSCRNRSRSWTDGSMISTTKPTPTGSCYRGLVPATSSPPRSSDDSVTPTGSPASPPPAHTPGSSRNETHPHSLTTPAGRPNKVTPDCVGAVRGRRPRIDPQPVAC